MPATVRVYPASTISNDMTVVGAGSAHAALSDASDASYLSVQVSSFEPQKFCRGELTDLPLGVETVTGVVINARAYVFSGDGKLAAGEYPIARLTNVLTGSAADYATGSINLGTTAAAVNALQYNAGIQWESIDGSLIRITEMNFDVSFEYYRGTTVAMILQWLGPLVGVGLHEMPKLLLELRRRSGIVLSLSADDLLRAWRELREHRARRVFA